MLSTKLKYQESILSNLKQKIWNLTESHLSEKPVDAMVMFFKWERVNLLDVQRSWQMYISTLKISVWLGVDMIMD